MEDTLVLYGERFASRVLLGTARYLLLAALAESIEACRPGMVTVALRRQMASDAEGGVGFFETLKQYAVPLLPNTAGCHTVQEEVTPAEMAR